MLPFPQRLLALFCALAAPLLAAAQPAEPAGRVLVALGTCTDSRVSHPVLQIQRPGGQARRSLRVASFFSSAPEYTDASGRYFVLVESLPAGEWEIRNFEVQSAGSNPVVTHRSRNDFALRFPVEPGKLTDLGRFCGASQAEGERHDDWKDRLFNIVVRLGYLLVSPSREEDVERARGEGGSRMEVIRPAMAPEKASALLRRNWVEPRIIVKKPLERPIELPR